MARSPVAATIVRDAAQSPFGQRNHLVVPHVRGERPGGEKNDGRALPPVLVEQSLTVASLDERIGSIGRRSRAGLRLPRLDSRHTQSARCGRDRRFENFSSIHAVPPKGVFGTSIDDALNSDNYLGCNERCSTPSLTVCPDSANLCDPSPKTLAFFGRQARPAVTSPITPWRHDHAKPTKASEQDP